MAGYSGKELAKKLGIKAGNRVVTLDAPDEVELGDMPDEVRVDRKLGMGPYHAILIFAKTRAELQDKLPKAQAKLDKNGAIWACWPSQDSDLNEPAVKAVGTASGLSEGKVIPIDGLWTGMRLAVAAAKKAPAKG